jgi:hypothetical protein
MSCNLISGTKLYRLICVKINACWWCQPEC